MSLAINYLTVRFASGTSVVQLLRWERAAERQLDTRGHAPLLPQRERVMLHQDHHRKSSGRIACWRLCCVSLGMVLLMLGCFSGGTTRRTSTLKSTKAVESSAAELVSRNQSLLGLYSSEIEAAADKVILESPSRTARRQALVWKAEAIPVMQTTLLNTDPVAAVLDTWVFIFQMRTYLEQPAVKHAFGESQSVIAETLKNMDVEMEQVIRTGAPTANVADLRRRVSAWAEAHPIQNSLAGRQSVDQVVIRKVGESDLGTMTSIKALGESLGDLTARLDSYNIFLPKQARWQAELLIVDVARDPEVGAALSNFGTLSNALAKTSGSMEHMPELMDQTRVALREDVDGQRLAAQNFFRNERLETLDDLRQERIATVAAMRSERVAATADLRGERQIVLDVLHNERLATENDFSAASQKAIQDLDTRGRRLIDHFFVRALELVVLTLALCSLVAWILLRQTSARRPPDSNERLYDRAA